MTIWVGEWRRDTMQYLQSRSFQFPEFIFILHVSLDSTHHGT